MKCIMPQYHSRDMGQPVILTSCDGSTYQNWVFLDDGSGNIMNAETLLCFNVNDGYGWEGAMIYQWECGPNSSPAWTTVFDSNFWIITSQSSGLALDVASGSTADGAQIDQAYYTGQSHQQWIISKY